MAEKHARPYIHDVIDGELDYQLDKWGPDHDEHEALGNFLIYIEMHLDLAKDHIYENGVGPKACAELRKIAALAFRGMQLFGASAREPMPQWELEAREAKRKEQQS